MVSDVDHCPVDLRANQLYCIFACKRCRMQESEKVRREWNQTTFFVSDQRTMQSLAQIRLDVKCQAYIRSPRHATRRRNRRIDARQNDCAADLMSAAQVYQR